ncbi:hypothetical protein [Neobacillus drentensis]|nr:hypothetical protein [Neobacillus drentensis]
MSSPEYPTLERMVIIRNLTGGEAVAKGGVAQCLASTDRCSDQGLLFGQT